MSGISRLERAERARLDQLQGFVELCMLVLVEERRECDKGIANLTGLSLSTVKRLQAGRFSTAVRAGTLQRLVDASGLSMKVEAPVVRVRRHAVAG